MRPCRSLQVALTMALSAAGVVGCTNVASTEPGDPPSDAGTPTALGNGVRIAAMNVPDSGYVNNQMNVAVTGATYIVTDTYAETGLSSSVGSVYVQDFHSNAPDAGGAPPYSGTLLYKSTFEPASLSLAPGDVIDFTGTYQKYVSPSFPAGQFQPEIFEPVVTFRFDYTPPTPTEINLDDLKSYATGYKWMSMLVTVKNAVGGCGATTGSMRGVVFLTGDTGQSAPTMDNELFALDYTGPLYGKYSPPPENGCLSAGQVKFKSVTGIVTYFVSFHISPRSQADIVLDTPDGG